MSTLISRVFFIFEIFQIFLLIKSLIENFYIEIQIFLNLRGNALQCLFESDINK